MYSWAPVDVPRIPVSDGITDRLYLHDTATGQPVAVDPDGGSARMYVCGITPYDATHLGHANTYVAFDLINRTWRDLGLKVNYTQNVTDVDDPLLERAQETGQDWEELAEDQTELFRSDMTDLRVIPPTHYIGAVESIPCVIELIDQLLPTGLVYQVDDPEHPDWYFNSVAAPGFGGISHLTEAEMIPMFAESGGDPDRPGKRHPLDCLVWRFSRPDEPSWQSQLGAGRPGWHIECTAIALHYLGPHFDVQGGGSDLVFPHHEMSAAEGVVATRDVFADAFVHSGMVGLDGEKMSKSLGNLELVSRLRQRGADAMAIRLALMDNHYRTDWDWTPERLAAATKRLDLWRRGLHAAAAPSVATIAAVREALRNDLDSPAALRAVDDWARTSLQGQEPDAQAAAALQQAVDALLGIAL